MDFPQYNYADEMMSPRELGITRDGSFDGIMRAVAGINYYSDAIGFGEATELSKKQGLQQSPLGIRFFVETGAKCSNGAKMYEYVDTIPKGMGGRVGSEVKAMGLPELRGLGPGIMQDALSALDPLPLLDTAARGGYAQCKQVSLPVGDGAGRLASRFSPDKPWIKGTTQMKGGVPHQTRWVFDKWISAEAYAATPKTAAAEGFRNADATTTFSLKTSQVAAVALLGALAVGMYCTAKR